MLKIGYTKVKPDGKNVFLYNYVKIKHFNTKQLTKSKLKQMNFPFLLSYSYLVYRYLISLVRTPTSRERVQRNPQVSIKPTPGSVFEFWEVLSILGSVFRFFQLFSILGNVLYSGKYFGSLL